MNTLSVPQGPSLIGLSLSQCIQAVIEGRVQADRITKIISGTAASSEADWNEIFLIYKQTVWGANPEMAERIVRQLLTEDKIVQPRVVGGNVPSILSTGIWVSSETEIVWKE